MRKKSKNIDKTDNAFKLLDTEGGAGRGGWGLVSVRPQLVYSVVFSYLLNFCRQWHLYKFLIFGDLSIYLLGLVFLCSTSEKMRIGLKRCILKNS